MAAHTPIPWETTGRFIRGSIRVGRHGTPDVCDVYVDGNAPAEAQANAHFIVRACNNHEALLKAAKYLLAPFHGAMWVGKPEAMLAALEHLRAAVAKAEGGA